jgi:DNA-binding XRE family transcriptional regulator
MRKKIKIPRIIKINKIDGFTIYCMFNNGENRVIDFGYLFEKWNVKSDDVEHPLLNATEFSKVGLRNYTLSWPNIPVSLINEEGEIEEHPYELSPDELYKLSAPVKEESLLNFGKMIRKYRLKAGLTQEQLARKIGSTRFYISRIENNQTDIEMSTFKKIVEAGLEKNLEIVIK